MFNTIKNKIKRFLSDVIEQFGSKAIYLIESEREVRELLAQLPPERLEHFGFKEYSQNDEDGIILEIFNRIGVTNKTFVEFGVGNGTENNTAALLRRGWNGLWLDGNPISCATIKKLYKDSIAHGTLKLRNTLVDKDNINGLIGEHIQGEIDLLSIDIDGNDYYVLDAIDCVKPRVIVAEYNAKFHPPLEWRLPYDKNYVWDGTDNQGMSLSSVDELARRHDFSLVATNITGSNAFFVRNDLMVRDGKELFPYPHEPSYLYNTSRYFLKFYSGHQAGKYLLLPA